MQFKRGQVTLFVIIAVIIVAVVVLVFFLLQPQIFRIGILPGVADPEKYIQDCLEQPFKETLELVEKQGGYYRIPDIMKSYQTSCLCLSYQTTKPEKCGPCNLQSFSHAFVASEIKKGLTQYTTCVDSMKQAFRDRGFEVVEGSRPSLNVEILENNVILNISYDVTFRKGDTVLKYKNFKVPRPSKLYSFIEVATNILKMEQKGDEGRDFRSPYLWLSIERNQQPSSTDSVSYTHL
ncbi:MAG: hypothetical protein N3G19_03755, partial [Candidatus Pacearchaeota archaeon]|nr:hypothetical protein [Candidatus Pacearchaeota archaeon]